MPSEAKIDSRSARRRLTSRREPYWRKLGRDRHLGYRKSDTEGTWIARYRDHTQQRQYQALGPADDVREANGTSVLSFEQAQERAREWFAQIESGGVGPRKRGAYAVADCMADYLARAKLHRKSHRHLEVYIRAYMPLNVWLGVTIGHERTLPLLKPLSKIDASLQFLSCEPVLTPLELDLRGIGWVIASGESGPRSRCTDPDWVRAIRDECVDADIPFFLKQWGNPASNPTPEEEELDHQAKCGATLDGRLWREFPER